MVFGSCCFIENERLREMNAKSVKIEGSQHGMIVNFEVTQTFIHSEKNLKEVRYIFPNDLKICIYDTTFVVGEEIIKPKLQSKEEAQRTYNEAVDLGYTAVYGSNIEHGLTEFKLGNVPPEIECKVILKIAFTAQMTTAKNFYIKFPLDVYTPSGSEGCLDTFSSQFSFQIQTDKENITKVTSNVINGNFDESTKIFSITDKIQNHENENSIIITFESKENIQSSAILTASNSSNYDYYALTIVPHFPSKNDINSEFIFVVDCSGSMGGTSIRKASECLNLFIRSLPPNSYFNIYRFGSIFDKLFKASIEYTDETAKQGIKLSNSLFADLGGTDILPPFFSVLLFLF